MSAHLDPLPLGEGDLDGLGKFSHLLEPGQRVRVRDRVTGEIHRGKITDTTSSGHVFVKLDSGHLVDCMRSEVTPEDFPEGERVAAKVAKRAEEFAAASDRPDSLAKFDPLGFEDGDQPGSTGESDSLAKRARFSVGESVRDKGTGRVGKVTRVTGEMVEIDFAEDRATGIFLAKFIEAV